MATLRLGSKIICPVKIIASHDIEALTISPSKVAQTIVSTNPVYNRVTLNAVNNTIDSNIKPENIKYGVSILGVTGTYNPGGVTRKISKTLDSTGKLCNSSILINLNNITTIGDYALAYGYYHNTLISGIFPFSSITSIGTSGLIRAFVGCTGLTSIDLSSVTTIGTSGLTEAFVGCTGLTNANLSSVTVLNNERSLLYTFKDCINITNINVSALTEISGTQCMASAFSNTRPTQVIFSSLITLTGDGALSRCFENCTSLQSLCFPALTSNSFGSSTNQFRYMLDGVTGCVVHFPSNLESVIGNWQDITTGFGGTNTVVLFDLPAYVRDSSLDLRYNPGTGGYVPAS